MNYDRYIPALRFEWLSTLYDPVMLLMRESTFKRTLVEQANIKNGYRLLDLGCGTATLTILIKKAYPGTEVTGLDGDPKILGALMYLISLVFRHLEETRDNIDGLLPEMFQKAGFDRAEETARFMTMFGTLSLYRAIKA
jgi:SAM-dependent methyltransferase